MPDDVDSPQSDDVLTPDAIANHTFHTAFRGFDPVEVRAFLARVADMLRVAEEEAAAVSVPADVAGAQEATEPAAAPVPPELAGADPAAVVAAAVAEAEEVLRDARERTRRMEEEAVAEGRRIVDAARAEGEALLQQASGEADAELRSAKSRARAEVGREATRLRAEAEHAAAEARVDAERHAAKVRQEAEQEAAAIIEAARERGREMVVEAQAARERMLTDLARRKRAAQAQIEQLRAGRDRLLESLKSARRTVDEVTLRFDATGEPVRRDRTDEASDAEAGREAQQTSADPGDREQSSADQPAGPEGERAAPGLPSLPEQAPLASEGVRIIGARPSPESARPTGAVARATAPPEPDDHGGSAPSGPGQPSPEAAGTSPADGRRSERKSSALRILRRARATDREESTPEATEPARVAPPEPGEGVRILAPHASDAVEAAAAEEESATTESSAPAEEAAATTESSAMAEAAPATEEGMSVEPTGSPVESDGAEVDADGATVEAVDGDEKASGDGQQPAGDEPIGEGAGEQPAEAGTPVDDIFARIRAEREAATAAAREVLAEDRSPSGADAGADADAEQGEAPPSPADADATGGEGEMPPRSGDHRDDADEALLQQRDQAVGELEESLTRRLKRTLQDEQNAALDRLRTHRGPLSADSLLGPGDEQAAPYREVARAHLDPAARSGAASSPMGAAAVSIDDLASQFAADIADSLRQRLDRALEQAMQEELEVSAIAERVNATYREWKTQRIQRMTVHYVSAAYNRGIFLATPEGTPLRWLVDDDGPCPDCDDNALSGATPRGETYPTGQMLPPAHVGCRCLLVRITT